MKRVDLVQVGAGESGKGLGLGGGTLGGSGAASCEFDRCTDDAGDDHEQRDRERLIAARDVERVRRVDEEEVDQ